MISKKHTQSTYITDEELMRISSERSPLQFERVNGELVVKQPVGMYSGYLESNYFRVLDRWAEKNGGEVYGPSAGFKLPNGDVRCPDVALLLPSHSFYGERLERFVPAAPDFCIEIRSRSDSFAELQEKMEQWVTNGCRLGVLIDPKQKKVYTYRRTGETVRAEEHAYDDVVTGEDVLPGFSFRPSEIDPE